MCRFLVYRGHEVFLADLITRPQHSLIMQSFRSRERPEPLNGDGFGIGWYTQRDPIPGLFTSLTPAWANRNLLRLSEKISSSCIFAHLRAASPGLVVSEINCHPFLYKHLLWMHNGRIIDFDRVKRKLRESLDDELYNMIQGTTDSEHAFAVFLNQLDRSKQATLPELKRAMLATLIQLNQWTSPLASEEPCMYNFAVTDGKNVVITRYSSDVAKRPPETLYVSKRCHYSCSSPQGEVHLDPKPKHAIIVASEPLTVESEDWEKVPPNSLLTINKDLDLTIEAIEV